MSISLTYAEAAEYRDQGYCGPFKLYSPEEMSDIKAKIRFNMELEAGEFFLFSENVVHSSLANLSSHNRLGLVARMTIPIVKIYHEYRYEGHGVLMVKGEDYMKINNVINPPSN